MAEMVAPSTPGSLLTITTIPGAGNALHTTVTLSGELDRSNEVEARQAIERLIHRGATHLIIDLGRLVFMDSSGVNLLARTHHALTQRQGILVVVAPNGAVSRILEMVRLTQVVPVYPSLRNALAEMSPLAQASARPRLTVSA
ncbi:MAG: STAS domain-containing protein [Armatimonadetes bacterium]|nr:STAS domain-containing protein [Armatimonadota bacterium]